MLRLAEVVEAWQLNERRRVVGWEVLLLQEGVRRYLLLGV